MHSTIHTYICIQIILRLGHTYIHKFYFLFLSLFILDYFGYTHEFNFFLIGLLMVYFIRLFVFFTVLIYLEQKLNKKLR